MKKISLPLAFCLIAGVACWPFDGEQALAAMSLRKQGEGKVEIVRGTEAIEVGGDDIPVEPGDLIRAYKGAQAQVALEGDRVAFLGGTSAIAGAPQGQMRIVDTTSVEAETGTVVAEADEAMDVVFGDAVASSDDGVFRIDRRSGSARAAVYSGTALLSAPGEANVVLERLMESPATASDLRPPQPYHLNPDDPFDEQRLGEVITLEQKLGQLSAGLASQLDREKPNLAYFEALADGQDVSPLKAHLKRSTIDLLVGFSVASTTEAYPFGRAVNDAFEYRDKGGTWGVIASILRSSPRLLVADLTNIAVSTGAVTAGTGEDVQFTVAAAEAAESGGTNEPIDPDPGDDDPQPPDDGDDPGNGGNDPGPGDDDEEAEDCGGGPECDAEEIRDRLLPSPDPSPTDFMDGP